MTDTARIKLAEAMNLPDFPCGFYTHDDKGDLTKFPGFNPFKDANDDYAVLWGLN